MFLLDMLVQKTVKHSPAEDKSRYDRDGVPHGQGEQHLDVLGEYVVIKVIHGSHCFSLVDHKISCYNSIGSKDDDECSLCRLKFYYNIQSVYVYIPLD